MDITLGYIYNKVLSLHLGGGNWWIPALCHIIMVDISEMSCGAHNDKSLEAVACTPELQYRQSRGPL